MGEGVELENKLIQNDWKGEWEKGGEGGSKVRTIVNEYPITYSNLMKCCSFPDYLIVGRSERLQRFNFRP